MNNENKKYYVEYWVDENSRDEGFGEIYDDFENYKDAKKIVDNLIDENGYASAEVILKEEFTKDGEDLIVFYGYDGDEKWGLIEENRSEATFTFLSFLALNEDDGDIGKKGEVVGTLSKIFSDEETSKKFLEEFEINQPEIFETIERDLIRAGEEMYLKDSYKEEGNEMD